MNILILGAGQVGSTLAENLSKTYDVTVVDLDREKLLALQSRLDIRTLLGSAASPKVLEEAGAPESEMVIAVTGSDETNILACQIAYSLFKVPTKIARVRAKEMADYPQLFTPENIPVDMIINPGELVTRYLERLISRPGAQMVLELADGMVQMLGLRVKPGTPLVGRQIREFSHDLADLTVHICGLIRQEKVILPNGEEALQPYDVLLVMAKTEEANTAIQTLLGHEPRYRRILIAGAGNIGMQLAQVLEEKYSVKVLEQSNHQCDIAAEKLNKTLVLAGDASDAELLLSENIDETDLFLSLTNDDEVNIMSAIVAKRLGAKNTIALVNKQTYAHYLIERSPDIDLAISPQRITGGRILRCLRKGDISNVYVLSNGQAEVLELVIHGEEGESKIIGKTIKQIRLAATVKVCALVRDETVILPSADLVLKDKDRLVLLLSDQEAIELIEKKFASELTIKEHP